MKIVSLACGCQRSDVHDPVTNIGSNSTFERLRGTSKLVKTGRMADAFAVAICLPSEHGEWGNSVSVAGPSRDDLFSYVCRKRLAEVSG